MTLRENATEYSANEYCQAFDPDGFKLPRNSSFQEQKSLDEESDRWSIDHLKVPSLALRRRELFNQFGTNMDFPPQKISFN